MSEVSSHTCEGAGIRGNAGQECPPPAQLARPKPSARRSGQGKTGSRRSQARPSAKRRFRPFAGPRWNREESRFLRPAGEHVFLDLSARSEAIFVPASGNQAL